MAEVGKSTKIDKGKLASQTEEALGWAAEGKKFADANPVKVGENQESTALSIADVPVFDRPIDASENDRWTGVQDELGNRQYKTIFGRTYFVRPAEDQRSNYEKIQQDIIPVVKRYLDNPTAPSREQTINFLKESLGAAWETFKIPGDLAAGNKGMEDVTLGNIFELAGGTGAASTVGKVPGGDSSNTMRVFGGPGARDYRGRALEKAAKMKSEGASDAEIEEMTGRVATAAPGSEISAGFPNQYKFEIPDAEIKIENPVANYADGNGLTVKESLEQVTNKPGEGFSLESFIPSHSELFRQYPDIKDTIVSFTDEPGYLGFYDSSNNSINIATELFEKGVNSPEFRSTFFHELQHALQAKDFIVTGMNFIANNNIEAMKVLSGSRKDSHGKSLFETHLKDDKNLLNTRSELLALGEEILKNPNSKKLSEKLAYKYQQLRDEVYLNYLRYGKEVEARIAGERATGTKGRSVVEEKANQLPDRVEFGSKINKPPNFLNRLSKALGMRPAKMTPKYLQKNIDEAMDFITSYNEAEDYSLAKTMMKSLDNPEPNSSPNQIKRYRDDIDPEVYDAFDELAEIQRGAPELAMTSAQRVLQGGVLSYALEHTGDLTHRMAEKGGVYGSEYVKPKVNRLLDSLTSEYGFEKEHLENLKNSAQFNYDNLGRGTNLSFEQFYKEYVDKAQEKIKAYAEEHKKVPVYNDMQLAGREAAIAIGEGRYTDAIEHLYTIKMAIDDGSYSQKAIEFNPKIDFRKNSDQGFAQGGEVGNMSMKKQMSLFEYGGIADDGMNKDPVSGNNVPPGSLAKEVRDDIPAMLSEGEYVVPADVLRYYGVNFFENLRGQAKQGLNTMEQNGRIGGTPMTQQDVARNMQQPMAPAPVQAAQGAMMQSPMRVQQQPAPQAVGNSGIPTQGYAGEDGSIVSRWSPARARYSSPMFQGTSSQQANIQTAQEQAATESITYMRTHYNQNGESIQVAYEGTDPASATPKAGQDQLLSDYPLTEEEWIAYKSEMSKNTGDDGGSGGGGDTTVSGGSDTSWMDGIDFGDTASVKKWVESDDGLGMSGGARDLADRGVIGLIPQGIQAQDIAKARGIRNYYDSIGDTEMVDYLDGKIKEAAAEGGILFSALDKLGLLTGKSYLEQIKSFAPTSLDLQRTFTADQRKEFTDTSGDMVKDEGGASVYKPGGIDVAMLDTSDDGPGLTAAEQHAVNTSRARAAASTAATEAAFEAGASTNTAEEIQDFKQKVEEAGGTWATSGRAEGGLMTTPKPKKKSKPKKTGLAGKK